MPKDYTDPKIIKFLNENYEKTALLRMRWVTTHANKLKKAATFVGEEKGYRQADVAKKILEAGLAATTRENINAGMNRRKRPQGPNIHPTTKDLIKEHTIPSLGLGDRESDPRLGRPDDDPTPDPIMRPVPSKQKEIIYKPIPEDGRRVYLKARSKLPKKRRRVLPVEQPRRKREAPTSNRRVNAIKNPVVLKENSPEFNKFGVNGMNMISLALQAPPLLRPPATNPLPLQARAPTVESPIINPQSGAISLASLQPPLMTAPPLQPRPATTGALDLMLPLQPKLLPGYNLTAFQSSFLSNTLSTVRPPDVLEKRGEAVVKEFKPNVEVIVEKRESVSDSVEEKSCELDREVSEVVNLEENCNNVELDDNFSRDEINSNVIDTTNTSIVSSPNDNSNDNSNDNDQCPNNNSSL